MEIIPQGDGDAHANEFNGTPGPEHQSSNRKINQDDREQGPRRQTILVKLGRRPLQPTPAIHAMNVTQLSQKHMINVFEDDGEIKTLMTTTVGQIADLLKNDFIIKEVPSHKGVDAVVEVVQRLKFMVPIVSGPLGRHAVTQNSGSITSHRRSLTS